MTSEQPAVVRGDLEEQEELALVQEMEGEAGKEPSPATEFICHQHTLQWNEDLPVDPRGQEGWRGHWRGPG